MTDIDSMPAGAEMDRLVAERVMGWTVMEIGGSLLGLSGGRLISKVCEHRENGRVISFHPSRDIGNAWEVVEHLLKFARSQSVSVGYHPDDGCYFATADSGSMTELPGPITLAETAPLAICRAALKAMA